MSKEEKYTRENPGSFEDKIVLPWRTWKWSPRKNFMVQISMRRG